MGAGLRFSQTSASTHSNLKLSKGGKKSKGGKRKAQRREEKQVCKKKSGKGGRKAKGAKRKVAKEGRKAKGAKRKVAKEGKARAKKKPKPPPQEFPATNLKQVQTRKHQCNRQHQNRCIHARKIKVAIVFCKYRLKRVLETSGLILSKDLRRSICQTPSPNILSHQTFALPSLKLLLTVLPLWGRFVLTIFYVSSCLGFAACIRRSLLSPSKHKIVTFLPRFFFLIYFVWSNHRMTKYLAWSVHRVRDNLQCTTRLLQENCTVFMVTSQRSMLPFRHYYIEQSKSQQRGKKNLTIALAFKRGPFCQH